MRLCRNVHYARESLGSTILFLMLNPLESASFHPLTNRKHHCRLCGRIICSLPVKFPQRPQTCSLLFVVDQSTGRIEEVGEGVDYGVRRRSTAAPGKPQKRGDVLTEEEKFLKGVRICRDCRSVLLYAPVHVDSRQLIADLAR